MRLNVAFLFGVGLFLILVINANVRAVSSSTSSSARPRCRKGKKDSKSSTPKQKNAKEVLNVLKNTDSTKKAAKLKQKEEIAKGKLNNIDEVVDKIQNSVSNQNRPFRDISTLLYAWSKNRAQDKEENSLQDYSLGHIEKAINSIAINQAAIKSMDGLTHQFRNTFKDSWSLLSRYETFASKSTPRKSTKSRKEAGKILEYINAVERSLQAAEILQVKIVLVSFLLSIFLL